MVTSKQIIKGVGMWLDAELLPSLHGFAHYGTGIAAALLSKRGEQWLDKARRSDAAKSMGIVVDGGFDYELLREILVSPFPPDGLRLEADQINGLIDRFLGKLGPVLNFRVQGGVTFHRADVEKIFDFVKET